MKTLVLGSKRFGKKNDPAVIAGKIGAELCFWEDLVLDIRRGEVEVWNGDELLDLREYGLAICLGWYKNGKDAIYRDLAFAMAKIFDFYGVRYWNSEMGAQRSSSKLSQMVILALDAIDVPHTQFSLDSKRVLARLKDGEKYIVKAAAASRGANNYLLNNLNEIERVMNESEANFLVQDFIPNDHDLRIVCFGGEAQLALKRSRTSSDTHLNNTSQGAAAEWIEIPDDLKILTARITRLLNREMGGVDFIESELDDGGKIYYCLEVNAIPQLTSGTDVERKMDALLKTVNGIIEK